MATASTQHRRSPRFAAASRCVVCVFVEAVGRSYADDMGPDTADRDVNRSPSSVARRRRRRRLGKGRRRGCVRLGRRQRWVRLLQSSRQCQTRNPNKRTTGQQLPINIDLNDAPCPPFTSHGASIILLGCGGTLRVCGCFRQSRSAEAAQAELARAAEQRQQVSGGARRRGEIMGLIITKTG
jgi:hypothetical protein